jgi:2-keto-4-pentenoate hydratase/2-oxohepta-3-ene-1,7-dioic acid hydratase in catechol pathway
MERWVRYSHRGQVACGLLRNESIEVHAGELLSDPKPAGTTLPVADVTLLTPTEPRKLIGLWNNFHARATKEGLSRPEHPLYFLKADNCYLASNQPIRRPGGYAGAVVFEGELGVVIGRLCTRVTVEQADRYIFGYTCVNDVTARDILKRDPSFVQWSRAKSFDTFGAMGPVVATGLDPDALRVRTLVNGEEKQNYPVSDMFFRPREIVSRLSHDMTLEPGDVIACGTSLGAGALATGDRVEVAIDGVGILSNVLV